MKESTHQHLEGELLDERYRVLRLIGMGGMGVVYEGIQEQLKRRVALKILSPKRRTRHDPVKRFRREAEAVAALSHPNVAQVFDLFVHDGLTVIAMEYIDGSSLSNILNVEGRLQPSRVISIALQILSALESTHAAHIVHRDLKPSNVMLAQVPGLGEWVKVVDFGIALMMEDTGVTRLTQGGEVLGTPAFMAPEQLLGGDIDIRTDIYSLGAVMFMALSGRRPYQVTSFKELLESLTTKPAPTAEDLEPFAPVQLARVVVRALSKAPDNRFETPREMINALKRALKEGVEEEDADPRNQASNREAFRSPQGSLLSKQSTRLASEVPAPSDDVEALTVDLSPTGPPSKPHELLAHETRGSTVGDHPSHSSMSTAMEVPLPEQRSSPTRDREPGEAVRTPHRPRKKRVLTLVALVIAVLVVVVLGGVGSVIAYQYFAHLPVARPERHDATPTQEVPAVAPLPPPKVLPSPPPPVFSASPQPVQVVPPASLLQPAQVMPPPASLLPDDRTMIFYLDHAISKAGELLPGGRLTTILGIKIDSTGRLVAGEQKASSFSDCGLWHFTFCDTVAQEEVIIRYVNNLNYRGHVSQSASRTQISTCDDAFDIFKVRDQLPDSDRLVQLYSKSPRCIYKQNDLFSMSYSFDDNPRFRVNPMLEKRGQHILGFTRRDGSLKVTRGCGVRR